MHLLFLNLFLVVVLVLNGVLFLHPLQKKMGHNLSEVVKKRRQELEEAAAEKGASRWGPGGSYQLPGTWKKR